MSKQLNCVLLRPHCASTFRTMRSAPVNADASSDSVLTEFRIEQPQFAPHTEPNGLTTDQFRRLRLVYSGRVNEPPEAFF